MQLSTTWVTSPLELQPFLEDGRSKAWINLCWPAAYAVALAKSHWNFVQPSNYTKSPLARCFHHLLEAHHVRLDLLRGFLMEKPCKRRAERAAGHIVFQ